MLLMLLYSISKHLMLLFNAYGSVNTGALNSFQNISCYCLTLTSLYAIGDLDKFQNISCYCLTNISNGEQTVGRISKHLMLLFNSSQHFHHCKLIQFQNISCYCLTCWNDIAIIIISLFQNISCYCLTKYKKKLKGVKLISKHLLLLFNL